MELFTDLCLCVLMVCLMLGALDQLAKLCQEKLTDVVEVSMSRRLVILIVEVALFLVLRWVVLR